MSIVLGPSPNRREILFYLLAAAIVFLLFIAAAMAVWYAAGGAGLSARRIVNPGSAADFMRIESHVRWVDPETGLPLWIVHTPAGFSVFSGRTPNDFWAATYGQACEFSWSEAVELFVDPCSGDHFNLDGELVRTSPGAGDRVAHRHLDRYSVEIDKNGRLAVDLDDLIPGVPAEEK